VTLFGHDGLTGHLFGWDKEFKYAGRVNSPPGNSFSVSDSVVSSLAGAFFLGGLDRSSQVFWSDGSSEVSATVGRKRGSTKISLVVGANVSLHDRVILCGPIVSDPFKVAGFCRRFPANSMAVCPLFDELPAFGCLIEGLCDKGLDWPRRANLFQPNTDRFPYRCREFDEKLTGDGFGRMAHAVSLGVVVVNDMMRGPGVSPFYGRLLSRQVFADSSVFIVNANCEEKFLRLAPLSLREAARCVPVICPVSDEFRESAKQDSQEAVVFISGLELGLNDFLRFYGVMTRRGVVVSGPIKLDDMKGALPVFRYNSVGMPDASEHRETSNGLERIL